MSPVVSPLEPGEARHLVVTGLVQGVGYRWSMLQEAQRLGASGWVRNRRDGSVEALVGGTAEVMAQMIAWARRGPPDAAVDHVHVEFSNCDCSGFEQRPTA